MGSKDTSATTYPGHVLASINMAKQLTERYWGRNTNINR
ncbi:MAG: hypothetical protein DNFNHJIP_00237 [Candidatus Argoarchaeum ethanivorans]|uniref:Uncharacterized protein n=1 Tax=Candidatus Argoarchaeum ethanivorans TaxID=2608793 RepID=A0A811ZZM0_9EURY|nr:MAG: hypothetical protein DNFNHJIP_00237 [Candidatus Argoarchaeum ethanivorans]